MVKEEDRWPAIQETMATGVPHGFMLKGYDWRRPDCVPIPDKRKVFQAFIQGVEEIYKLPRSEVVLNLVEGIDPSLLQGREKLGLSIPPRAEEIIGEDQDET
jgi:hypothetical protein